MTPDNYNLAGQSFYSTRFFTELAFETHRLWANFVVWYFLQSPSKVLRRFYPTKRKDNTRPKFLFIYRLELAPPLPLANTDKASTCSTEVRKYRKVAVIPVQLTRDQLQKKFVFLYLFVPWYYIFSRARTFKEPRNRFNQPMQPGGPVRQIGGFDSLESTPGLLKHLKFGLRLLLVWNPQLHRCLFGRGDQDNRFIFPISDLHLQFQGPSYINISGKIQLLVALFTRL